MDVQTDPKGEVYAMAKVILTYSIEVYEMIEIRLTYHFTQVPRKCRRCNEPAYFTGRFGALCAEHFKDWFVDYSRWMSDEEVKAYRQEWARLTSDPLPVHPARQAPEEERQMTIFPEPVQLKLL